MINWLQVSPLFTSSFMLVSSECQRVSIKRSGAWLYSLLLTSFILSCLRICQTCFLTYPPSRSFLKSAGPRQLTLAACLSDPTFGSAEGEHYCASPWHQSGSSRRISGDITVPPNLTQVGRAAATGARRSSWFHHLLRTGEMMQPVSADTGVLTL